VDSNSGANNLNQYEKRKSSQIRDEPEIISEVVHDLGMKSIMKLEQFSNIEDIQRFLDGTSIVAFNVVTTKQERYQWTLKALKKHQYRKLRRAIRHKNIFTFSVS
jgi:hypothetical protein